MIITPSTTFSLRRSVVAHDHDVGVTGNCRSLVNHVMPATDLVRSLAEGAEALLKKAQLS
jgi:hypothetical protein